MSQQPANATTYLLVYFFQTMLCSYSKSQQNTYCSNIHSFHSFIHLFHHHKTTKKQSK